MAAPEGSVRLLGVIVCSFCGVFANIRSLSSNAGMLVGSHWVIGESCSLAGWVIVRVQSECA